MRERSRELERGSRIWIAPLAERADPRRWPTARRVPQLIDEGHFELEIEETDWKDVGP